MWLGCNYWISEIQTFTHMHTTGAQTQFRPQERFEHSCHVMCMCSGGEKVWGCSCPRPCWVSWFSRSFGPIPSSPSDVQWLHHPLTGYYDGWHDSSLKVKPDFPPLVVDYSTCHELLPSMITHRIWAQKPQSTPQIHVSQRLFPSF